MIGNGKTISGYEMDVSPAVEIQMANIFFIPLFVHLKCVLPR
jgi:hypothetical protein